MAIDGVTRCYHQHSIASQQFASAGLGDAAVRQRELDVAFQPVKRLRQNQRAGRGAKQQVRADGQHVGAPHASRSQAGKSVMKACEVGWERAEVEPRRRRHVVQGGRELLEDGVV